MGDDLVSILMPIYNAAFYVREAIQSCIDQTHEKWELIVIDDASTDGSTEIVNSIQDARVHLVRLSCNVGPGAARNVALAHARGEWITVLDADDLYRYDRLASLIRHSRVGGNRYIFMDRMERPRFNDSISKHTLTHSKNIQMEFTPITVSEWLAGPHVGQPFFHASGLADNRVRYPESRAAEDTAFLVRLAQRNCLSIAETPELSYIYRITPKSLSRPTLENARERERVYSDLLAEFPTQGDLSGVVQALLGQARREREWLELRLCFADHRMLTAIMMLVVSPSLVAKLARHSLRAAGRRIANQLN